MWGIEYKKSPPTRHVILHESGKLSKQGAGLNFWYFAPISSVSEIPLVSQVVPFIFNEPTADFQTISVQGQLTYKISNPEQAAQMLDFSVDEKGRYKATGDSPIQQLETRLVNTTQVVSQSIIRPLTLREILKAPHIVVSGILEELKKSDVLTILGVQILDLAILNLSPTKETARALESETRERILQQSDQAIYLRRNAAVEEERRIKESELNTEKAVETKKREIRETRMAADIAIEEQREALISKKTENDRKEADSRAYALESTLKPVRDIDWRTLIAMAGKNGGDSRMVMSLAFQELAENASKIGTLNLTPDLLQTLLNAPPPAKSSKE